MNDMGRESAAGVGEAVTQPAIVDLAYETANVVGGRPIRDHRAARPAIVDLSFGTDDGDGRRVIRYRCATRPVIVDLALGTAPCTPEGSP